MICRDMSFRHSSDCHSYYRTHFLIVMTFCRLAPPYMSQLFCHHSLRHLSHASAFVTASSHSLSFSPFARPSVVRLYRLYIRVLHSSSFHLSRSSFRLSHELYSTAPAPAAPFIRLPVRNVVRGRWASAERRPSSLRYVPSSNNGASTCT